MKNIDTGYPLLSKIDNKTNYVLDDKKFYDPDSSTEVWEKVHKVLYEKSDKLNEIFNFGNFEDFKEFKKQSGIDKKNNIKYIRLIANAKKNNRIAPYTIGGDTDFNFNVTNFKCKSCNFNNNCEKKDGFDKYCCYYKLNLENKNDLKDLIKNKYCLYNYSLMLTTGGRGSLQAIKCRRQKFNVKDNICEYINFLYENFYKNKSRRNLNSILFKDANPGYRSDEKKEKGIKDAKNIMYEYLNKFKDIYEYCREIYKIEEELVDRILRFANKNYKDNVNEGIKEFIDIVRCMWKSKEIYIEKRK